LTKIKSYGSPRISAHSLIFKNTAYENLTNNISHGIMRPLSNELRKRNQTLHGSKRGGV
jgi:hypothetical protein